MTLKIIKTDTLTTYTKCGGSDFVKSGQGWACNQCFSFIWPILTNDIKKDKR